MNIEITNRYIRKKNRKDYTGRRDLMGMLFETRGKLHRTQTLSLISQHDLSQQNVGQDVFPLVAYSLGRGCRFLLQPRVRPGPDFRGF